MNYLGIGIAITFMAFLVISYFYQNKMRNQLSNQLTQMIMDKQFNQFDKVIDQKKTKYLIQPFNIDFLKLNSYLARGDNQLVEKQLDHLDKVNLNLQQKISVYSNVFYYYLSLQDENKTPLYYQKLETLLLDEEEKKNIARLYDTYIAKKANYLDETLEELDHCLPSQKSTLLILISNMYKNLDDLVNAKKYMNLADEALNAK